MAAKEQAVVIGGGFAGLSAACFLAKRGYAVKLVDRHDMIGGRARYFETDGGFRFDMGPSWYWMPDVFEGFFAKFGKKVSDYYKLKRLDPPYRVYFKEEEIDMPDTIDGLADLFEKREKGAGEKMRKFLTQAKYKYDVGMADFVQRPSVSITEFTDIYRLVVESMRLHMLTTQRAHVRSYFSDDILVKIMEWPVLFLGGAPDGVPALYSLMDHASCVLGTWYPEKGMHTPIEAFESLAKELGVEVELEVEVEEIVVGDDGLAKGLKVRSGGAKDLKTLAADVVVATGDYHWIEQKCLKEARHRRYSEPYWDKRVMSPGSLLFYLGLNKRLDNLQHHNLFFDEDLDVHCSEIYDEPAWPKKPLFYVCVPSLTDDTVAPEGCENVFVLIPLAPGLEDTEEMREKYYDIVMARLEARSGQDVRGAVVYKRGYAHRDFEDDYHSFKGNAYGLANTLLQTAFFKPSMQSNVPNLFFAGQLAGPGPGVPPTIISGESAAKLVDQTSYLRTRGANKTAFAFVKGLFAAFLDIFAMTTLELISGSSIADALRSTAGRFLFVAGALQAFLLASVAGSRGSAGSKGAKSS